MNYKLINYSESERVKLFFFWSKKKGLNFNGMRRNTDFSKSVKGFHKEVVGPDCLIFASPASVTPPTKSKSTLYTDSTPRTSPIIS